MASPPAPALPRARGHVRDPRRTPALLPLAVALIAAPFLLTHAAPATVVFVLATLGTVLFAIVRRTPRAATRAPVLYDDDCAFCMRSMRVILALDAYGALEPVAFSDVRGRGFARGISDERLHASFHIELPTGTASAGDAVWEIASRLPLLGPPSRLIRRARPARECIDVAYAWIVENRFRFGPQACGVATQERPRP